MSILRQAARRRRIYISIRHPNLRLQRTGWLEIRGTVPFSFGTSLCKRHSDLTAALRQPIDLPFSNRCPSGFGLLSKDRIYTRLRAMARRFPLKRIHGGWTNRSAKSTSRGHPNLVRMLSQSKHHLSLFIMSWSQPMFSGLLS